MPLISEFPVAGPQGKQGPPGPQGKQGPEGKRGPMGPAGPGTGDMLAMVYDPQGKALDMYKYAEEIVGQRAAKNRSFLRNGYFVGGGSQQGGGQFPINQREQTRYGTNVPAFDGWITTTDCSSLTISQDGIICNAIIAGQYPLQSYLDLDYSAIAGREITISALVDDALLTATDVIPVQKPSVSNTKMIMSSSGSLYDIGLGYSANKDCLFYGFFARAASASAKFKAAKLELGPTQTLAYQDEEGNWQLFEKPDYGEELAKCKRYLQMINTRMLGVGFKEPGNGGVWMSFGFPVEMRVNPTVTVKMLPQFAYGNVTATGTVWTSQTSIDMSCSFALPEGNGITDYRACVARNTGIVFELSAEL